MLSDLFRLVRLSRLFDAAFPIVSLFLGVVVTGQLNNHSLYLLVPIVIILNSVAMIWNDIEDREIDADNGRPELVKSNVALLGRLKIYLVILIAVGILLAWLVNAIAFVLAIATVCIIWIYNSKPIQASRRPILSIVVLSGAGAFLPYLFGLSLGNIGIHVLIAGVCWWFGRISLSVLKDYKDARGDARHNKKTFLLCYGVRKVAVVSVISLCVGYGALIGLMFSLSNTTWGLLALITTTGVFAYMRRPLFDSKSTYVQLDSSFRKIAQYQLLLDVGVVLWLI